MVKMVHLDTLEMMVPLESLDLKGHLVIKAMMPLSEIAVDAHPTVLLKVTKVLLVNQEILVNLAILAHKVPVVNLVNAFLVIVENLEQMVNQVRMELMVYLVNQVNLENLEILLMLNILPVQIPLLT